MAKTTRSRACGDVPANCPHDGHFVDRVLSELGWVRSDIKRLQDRVFQVWITLAVSLVAALGAVVLQLLDKSG